MADCRSWLALRAAKGESKQAQGQGKQEQEGGESLALPAATAALLKLVVAGGFDPRVAENVQHHAELKAAALRLGLTATEYPDMAGQVRCLFPVACLPAGSLRFFVHQSDF